MKKSELRQIIKEVIQESMGNRIEHNFSVLLDDIHQLKKSGYIDNQEASTLHRKVGDLVKFYQKILKNKGLIGW